MNVFKPGHVKCIPDTLKVAFSYPYYLKKTDVELIE